MSFRFVAFRFILKQRLLIPLSAGGLVIGRKGSNIAILLKASGAKVTLGQKGEVKANERIVTMQGTLTATTKVKKRQLIVIFSLVDSSLVG